MVKHLNFNLSDMSIMTVRDRDYYFHLFMVEMEEKKKMQEKANRQASQPKPSKGIRR